MKMRRRLAVCIGILAVASMACLVPAINSESPFAAEKKIYSATLYMGGMGGHFAKADVTIDPAEAEEPIRINNLDKVAIGTMQTHPTHDPRVDVNDRNILFWSTYALDPEGKMHMGKLDLTSGKVIKDFALSPETRSPGKKPPLYCGSGQTQKYYMPVFMGTEGYVDVVAKETLQLKHRLFISDLGYRAEAYQTSHGTNSPDMKKFLLTINLLEAGKSNGKVDFLLVDLPLLENGKWKVLAHHTHQGEPGKTINFRQYFSNDGRHIYQAVGDRLWVLDAGTLKLVDEKRVDGQIHDAMPTPDGKYAVLTIRNATSAIDPSGNPIPGRNITDGTLKLYDLDGKKLAGKAVSTCQACHKNKGLGDKNAVFCGVDGNWKE